LDKPLRQVPFENDSAESLPFQSLITSDKMNPIQLAMLQSSRTRMVPPKNYSKYSFDNNNFDAQNLALNNSFNINFDSIYDDSEDNFDL
jgi:hypothetical protein